MKKDLVQIVFGSKLYGTNNENSDNDYKIIFLPDINDLLLGKIPRNYKTRIAGPNDKVGADEDEFEYIPIHQFAQHFLDGQTYSYELAFAILFDDNCEFHTCLNDDLYFQFEKFNRELIAKFLTSDISKMVSYAIHQAQVYGLKGGRLQSMKDFVEALKPVANLNDDTTLEAVKDKFEPLFNEFMFYDIIKGTNESYINQQALMINKKAFVLTNSVKYVVAQVEKMIEKYGHRAEKAITGNVDWKALSHAIRVVYQANEILDKGSFFFPLPFAPYLKQVKLGQVPYDEAIKVFEELNSSMEEKLKTTTLPSRTPELKEKFNEWLVDWLKCFYEIKG